MGFNGSNRLHIGGFVFDEVQAISEYSPLSISDGKNVVRIVFSWTDFIQEKALQTGVSEKEIYRCVFSWLRTVIFNEAGSDPWPRPGDLDLLPALGLENEAAERWSALIGLFENHISPPDQDPQEWLWQYEIVTRAQRAGLIVTRDKRVGLVHVDSKVGDKIAILAAGNVPLTLRPVSVGHAEDQMYRIVGGCYIDGMSLSVKLDDFWLTTSGAMYGEVVDEQAKRLCAVDKSEKVFQEDLCLV